MYLLQYFIGRALQGFQNRHSTNYALELDLSLVKLKPLASGFSYSLYS